MSGSKKLQIDDDELFAVASGDEVAFGLLYDRVSPCLFGLVVRIVAERMLAEKTLLTIFSLIWRHAHTFDPAQSTAQRWVFDIAYRCAATRRTAPPAGSGTFDVVELAFFDGLTPQQIAERTGATVASVRASMRSGLDRLRVAGELPDGHACA